MSVFDGTSYVMDFMGVRGDGRLCGCWQLFVFGRGNPLFHVVRGSRCQLLLEDVAARSGGHSDLVLVKALERVVVRTKALCAVLALVYKLWSKIWCLTVLVLLRLC